MSVYSIYVEKKPPFAVEARAVLSDLHTALQLQNVKSVRVICRYLVENISPGDLEAAKPVVFSEPPVDTLHDAPPQAPGARMFAVEYLPGQFDQRADSCSQCIALLRGGDRPTVRTAKIYILEGDLTDADFAAVKGYLINPVESREACFDIPETLELDFDIPTGVETLDGFTELSQEALQKLHAELSLAMDLDDLLFCQSYFLWEEDRCPTMTELRMIDTYWSDHCRHTTFMTQIDNVQIEPPYIRDTFRRYRMLRGLTGRQRSPVTLMDLATIGVTGLRRRGLLNRLDQSEEINACSVNVLIDVDGSPEDWLLMFKNETHNHPTEIEPFGGAATCLGGAIRDPLSGRSYVYQAMRITGAASPLQKTAETLPGKLPQRKLVQTAAAGYSSYGNQVGLATGLVHEIYHPGYVAKRMEIGAVVGAAPAKNVVREEPKNGDIVILLGGRTGRDGCGGATGSSKSHTQSSLGSCGAEVQKGNPPEERKLQRLFRNPEATRMIKRCNDFGAGGVAVSIGELADGVRINLDAVPKKYEGLDGTELAISESQERMSVVVKADDAQAFIRLADAENLEATPVAVITGDPRLVMEWNGNTIVNLSRSFLNSNGASKHTRASIPAPVLSREQDEPVTAESLKRRMSGLDFCSRKGLVERFDSTIGAGSVLLPYGGRYQSTPAQAMAAKFPVPRGETDACSIMAWGFNPKRSAESPYHGAMEAVVHSVAKVIAAGGSRKKCWLSFQEYFERLGDDSVRWGKPVAALLGALEAQLQLQVAAIGGKDSMSGSFEDIDVPPTLVSFAVGAASASAIISPEFKQAGSYVYLLQASCNEFGLPDFDDTRVILDLTEQLIADGAVISAWAAGEGGVDVAVCNMCFGNRIGFAAEKPLGTAACCGSFVLESAEPIPSINAMLLGRTIPEFVLRVEGREIGLMEIQAAWESTLEPVFPRLPHQAGRAETFTYEAQAGQVKSPAVKSRCPKVVIPVFPGTNCEYDTARSFQRAGAEPEIFVVRNLTGSAIHESVRRLAALIDGAQILALPGGFSGGDEPDGSAKFIVSLLRSGPIAEALAGLLEKRDGLTLGICNGFQALIKLGLLPWGEIRDPEPGSPTLTHNSIGRHQSGMVRTRVASNKSPWLCHLSPGEVFTVPVSHGEGRFVADEALVKQLARSGQIATQYVDFDGGASMDIRHNPNNSVHAVEGLLSLDGRVLGKMAHNERWSHGIYKNIPGCHYMDIFSGAVKYYK